MQVDEPEQDERSSEEGFDSARLDSSVISLPLFRLMEADAATELAIIIDPNLEYEGGLPAARERILELIQRVLLTADVPPDHHLSTRFVFAKLQAGAIRTLARMDAESQAPALVSRAPGAQHAIYRIWPDWEVSAHIVRSIVTVKAKAAHAAFSAFGKGMVWAVMDSGIDGAHAHFVEQENLSLDQPLDHRDFTGADPPRPLVDGNGHGTHVAGIIAGGISIMLPFQRRADFNLSKPDAFTRRRDADGNNVYDRVAGIESIAGMAPLCKLLSLKVLDEKARGDTKSLISAIEYVQQLNEYGQQLRVHGVNMSLGYSFDPEWFACGQSPLCVAVERLVRSGVVVVVSSGNTGYVWEQTVANGTAAAGADLTINDPGNADLAITVGSTHREMPHIYGVSYFSSKGPTGDGRLKPDLIAPGEKILSAASGKMAAAVDSTGAAPNARYVEESGTSMAAAHVSGAIAAFLSVNSEFVGRPERVKEIFMASATDLGRDRTFQGSGLIDLMRAIQSV